MEPVTPTLCCVAVTFSGVQLDFPHASLQRRGLQRDHDPRLHVLYERHCGEGVTCGCQGDKRRKCFSKRFSRQSNWFVLTCVIHSLMPALLVPGAVSRLFTGLQVFISCSHKVMFIGKVTAYLIDLFFFLNLKTTMNYLIKYETRCFFHWSVSLQHYFGLNLQLNETKKLLRAKKTENGRNFRPREADNYWGSIAN